MPSLAACLTLSKNDFIRTGARGASYLAYRKAIQEVVSRQLAEWGHSRDAEARPRIARLERDLERVLEDLADDFPLLRSLFERRAGGQKRLPMPGRGDERVPASLIADMSAATGSEGQGSGPPAAGGSTTKPPEEAYLPSPESFSRVHEEMPPSGDRSPSESEPISDEAGPPRAQIAAAAGTLDTVAGRWREARYGLQVQFEARPADLELGRLVDSTIWINAAHPAHTRAVAARSLGYHTALAVGVALAPLAVEPRNEHMFITQFLAYWGSAQQ